MPSSLVKILQEDCELLNPYVEPSCNAQFPCIDPTRGLCNAQFPCKEATRGFYIAQFLFVEPTIILWIALFLYMVNIQNLCPYKK